MAEKMTPLGGIQPISVEVNWPSDVARAVELGKGLATSLGYAEAPTEEIGLVITELAANLIRHASGGTIRVKTVADGARDGIEVQSTDNGPGIPDVEQAITDGYSTAGGLGTGLGSVNRMMDEFEIHSGTNGGTHIVCRRWQRPPGSSLAHKVVAFGAATRAYRRAPENGDTFVFKQWERSALAGVIDGLGHGPLAQKASQTARQYVESHFDQPLEHLFRGADRACRATRGVVMALARFDLAKATVTVASVGNIEVRLAGGGERFNLIVRRGVVGMNAPNPVLAEHPWTADTVLIMHSDGLHTHWSWNDFSELKTAPPAVIANQLLARLGKIDDDSTVIVARSVS
jgi:anti-sigma regulatory factor (Ser/Thr protein kinase)/serine/threonine protein phosphatase PrpC